MGVNIMEIEVEQAEQEMFNEAKGLGDDCRELAGITDFLGNNPIGKQHRSEEFSAGKGIV